MANSDADNFALMDTPVYTMTIFDEHPVCEYCSVNQSEVLDFEGIVACEGCAKL